MRSYKHKQNYTISLKKRLAFTPKMRKLSLTRQAASTKTQTKRKVENIMKTGKITAKLRDAVPVCLMVEGKETVQEH